MARVSGNSGLNFSGSFDVQEILRNQQMVITGFNDMKKAAEQSMGGTGFDANALKQQQLMTQQALRESRLEFAKLATDLKALGVAYQQGKIDQQAYRTESARLRLEQQQLSVAAREARKNQAAAVGSYREATARLKQLENAIKGVAGGFEATGRIQRARIKEYTELNERLKAFDRTLGNHQRNVGNYTSALNGLKGLASSYLGAFAILGGVNKVIQANAQISDSLADVRRTASLTAEEAENLANQLKKIDTRTSLKGLLEIATIGGQLGIAKDQLAGFTKAVDQLAVSLGGELQGGAEGVAKSLGVLDNVFGITKKNGGDVERSLNQIGSAILGLGQSGLATGDFLADFSERVGGIGKQAGLALPVILSYGAVLQENGVSAEVAGSSFKRLISSLATNREKFYSVAKIADANLTLKDFTRIINTDAQKALQLFFAGLQKGGPTTTAFNDILKGLKLSGAGVSQTIAALAGHQAELNGHIEQTTIDFDNGTLSAEQFRLKNDNLAGSLEKLNNEFEKSVTSGAITAFFKAVIDGARSSIIFVDKLATLIKSSSYDKAIKNYEKNKDKPDVFLATKTGNLFINEEDVKAEIRRRNELQLRERINEQIKIGKRLGQDIILDNKQTGETVASITREEQKLAKIRAERAAEDAKGNKKSVKELTRINNDLIRQKEIVKTLKNEYASAPKVIEGTATVDFKKGSKKNENDGVAAQRALQKQIDELARKGTQKRLTEDQEEIANVEAKYNNLLEKAKEFNTKKSNIEKNLRVDAGKLIAAQDDEINKLRDKQATAKLKETLDEQKKLYDDYEAYKLKVGAENAKALVSQNIASADTYLDYLKQKESEILDPQKQKGSDADAGSTKLNEQQLKLIQDEIKIVKEAKKKADAELFASAYQAAETYYQKALAIEKDFQDKKNALGVNATKEQIANLELEKNAKIRANNEANAYSKSGYEELMMNFDAMSRGAIIKRLEEVKAGYREEYKAGKLNAEQLKRLVSEIDDKISGLNGNNPFNRISAAIKNYKKQLETMPADSQAVKEAQKEMFAEIAAGAGSISTVIGALASSFAELGIGGEGLQDTLKNVSGVVDGLGGIAQGIASGNPVDIVTGSIKLLTSAIQLFNQKDKKIEKQITKYKEQLTSLGNAYKQLERDVANAVGNDIYNDQAQQIENLLKQQELLTKARDAERNKKKSDQDKIDEYNQQLNDIPNQIDDINKAISQNLIQTNFRDLSNALADAFTDAFKTGEDRAKSFEAVFNNVIANAVKNSLKLSILDPIVKKFTDDLTKYARDNNNSIIGFDFEEYKKQLKDAGELFNAGLKGSEEFFKESGIAGGDANNSLKGSIKANLTEETGTILAGAFNGMKLSLFNIDGNIKAMLTANSAVYAITQQQLSILTGVYNNTLRTANNTDELARLAGMENALNSISKNTGDSVSLQLRAAGYFKF